MGFATRMRVKLLLVSHAAFAVASGCSSGSDTSELLARVTTVASEIHAALPADRPGYGTTDYPGNAAGDVPKSYAMVLLAETERLGKAWRGGEANLATTAGEWLLNNADADGDGTVGWGLPVAWDAYDDGTVNPPNTEYTISTAIVIDALLTWAERDPRAPRERIRDTVSAAIEPYLDPQVRSPSGMAPYSLSEADRRYDTFNPAAYLAGQIQRASLVVSDPVVRARYLDAADATMRAVIQHRRLVPGTGHWYWNYSIQQDLPNDLPHAGYMIDGIRTYIEGGGRLADEFDWTAVLSHLQDFKGESGLVRAFPTFFTKLTLAARSYDLGFALHLACTESNTAQLVPWLIEAASLYRTPQARYLKMPLGTSGAPGVVINEYEAYLYRGMTSCAVNVLQVSSSSDPSQLRADPGTARLALELTGARSRAGDAIPLLPANAGVVSFDSSRRATLALPSGKPLTLSTPGVPVKVMQEDGVIYVFHRRFPDDRLSLMLYQAGRLRCRLPVEHEADSSAVASLRAASLHEGRLHAVVYHNPSLANWYLSWRLPRDSDACPTPVQEAVRLPSLGNPAGATYEMVPRLEFVAARTNSWSLRESPSKRSDSALGIALAGGNVEIPVLQDGLGSPRRVPGCQQIIESSPTPLGLAHLCSPLMGDPASQIRAPHVVAPSGITPPRVDVSLGVPWRLRWSLDALHVDHARTPRQLRHLFRHDMVRTTPGGWMEFGINNEEGRVAWSQIYYLNGWLDAITLATRHRPSLEWIGPLLPEIRRRLDMEFSWLDTHIAAGRHRTRAFTVDRSPALFGVQTGRLLVAVKRYQHEVPTPHTLPSFDTLRRAVPRLDGHIEVLATDGESERWIRPGTYHLRWPKGSKFSFDGMPVPYNHQNEWANAVLETADDVTPTEARRAAVDILHHFVDRVASAGTLPLDGSWDYWWGRAYDGWTEADQLSVNRPRYAGDRIKAWISFRTIDAMALATSARYISPMHEQNARASLKKLIAAGHVYPFANLALLEQGGQLHVTRAVAMEYARVSAPWEVANFPWSAAALLASPHRLNDR